MKLKVILSYSWEFDSKEWNDLKKFSEIEKDLSNKTKYDHIDVFYHLRNIHEPVLHELKIEEVKE